MARSPSPWVLALAVVNAGGCGAPGCDFRWDLAEREQRDLSFSFPRGELPPDAAVAAEQPEWGPTVRGMPAPPPLGGNTLLALRDGRTAVASDPDRDTVWIA